MRHDFLKLCALTGLTFVLVASADDWPQWRGPNRDGISRNTGLLKQWPKEGPPLVWTSTNLGIGFSSVSITGGKLFTMGVRDAVEHLVAADAKTGKELWATPVGPIFKTSWGSGPRSTPTVDGDMVFAVGGHGTLLAARVSDGKEVWQTNLRDHGGTAKPGWGFSESVLVDEGKVICTPGGKQGTLLALDKTTGKKIWQSADWTDPAHYSSAIVAVHNGTRQYIQFSGLHVAGVAAKDGRVLWTSDWPRINGVIPTPIYRDDHVYVTTGSQYVGVGACKLLKLGPNHEVTEVYRNDNMSNTHGGVLLLGDKIYGYSDKQGKQGWICQDFLTGEVVWTAKGLQSGSLVCADGMLFCLETSGFVVLVEASDQGWREKGRFRLAPKTELAPKGRIWTHPVVCDGRLYLRDQELLFCFDVKAK